MRSGHARSGRTRETHLVVPVPMRRRDVVVGGSGANPKHEDARRARGNASWCELRGPTGDHFLPEYTRRLQDLRT